MSGQIRRATAADIAAIAGVAKSTVSLAFSTPERVSSATRDRILKVARDVGYTPHPLAQSLKTGRNNLVGLILQDLTNPHGGAVLQHVQKTAMDAGYMVMTATAAARPDTDLRFAKKFEELNVRAAIIMPSGSDEPYVDALIASPVRFVTYGHRLARLACDHVGLNNRLAVRLLVDHLVDLGHTRIGHIAGNQAISSGVERLAGTRDSLAAAGLKLDPRHLGHGNYDEQTAFAAAREILARDDRPTALVSANNVTAVGALRAANALGLRCPEDISIATVDQLPWGDLMSPRMTCAAQPIDEMARRAATWLIERLENDGGDEALRVEEFQPKLIVGTSTGSRLNNPADSPAPPPRG